MSDKDTPTTTDFDRDTSHGLSAAVQRTLNITDPTIPLADRIAAARLKLEHDSTYHGDPALLAWFIREWTETKELDLYELADLLAREVHGCSHNDVIGLLDDLEQRTRQRYYSWQAVKLESVSELCTCIACSQRYTKTRELQLGISNVMTIRLCEECLTELARKVNTRGDLIQVGNQWSDNDYVLTVTGITSTGVEYTIGDVAGEMSLAKFTRWISTLDKRGES